MNKATTITKYILVAVLAVIAALQLILAVQSRQADSVMLIGILVPLFFIVAILRPSRITWLLAIVIAVYGIIDVFYWGSYSATAPRMEFTQVLSEITAWHWLKRALQIFAILFYPAAFVLLLLPAVRKKYFRHA